MDARLHQHMLQEAQALSMGCNHPVHSKKKQEGIFSSDFRSNVSSGADAGQSFEHGRAAPRIAAYTLIVFYTSKLQTLDKVPPVGAETQVTEVHNTEPTRNGFWFKPLEDVLVEAGQYRLEFQLLPALPGELPMAISTPIHVTAGPAASLEIEVHCCAVTEDCSAKSMVWLALRSLLFDARSMQIKPSGSESGLCIA